MLAASVVTSRGEVVGVAVSQTLLDLATATVLLCVTAVHAAPDGILGWSKGRYRRAGAMIETVTKELAECLFWWSVLWGQKLSFVSYRMQAALLWLSKTLLARNK